MGVADEARAGPDPLVLRGRLRGAHHPVLVPQGGIRTERQGYDASVVFVKGFLETMAGVGAVKCFLVQLQLLCCTSLAMKDPGERARVPRTGWASHSTVHGISSLKMHA